MHQMNSTARQALSPFKWLTDTQTYKTTTILEADGKNRFATLPTDLVNASSNLIGTSTKLTKTLSPATTNIMEKSGELDNVFKDAGVVSVEPVSTRSNISNYWGFQEGGTIQHRDVGFTANSEIEYTTMPMTKPDKNLFTTRSGVMVQGEWAEEPQIQRGGVNTRYAER